MTFDATRRPFFGNRTFFVGLVGGLLAGLVAGSLVFRPPSTPRVEVIDGTVVAVNADRSAIGVRQADGSDVGFSVGGPIDGADLLRRGDRVRIDVAYLDGDSIVVRVRPA